MSLSPDVGPPDISAAARQLVASIGSVEDATIFDRTVAGMDWTARRTIDHLADALVLYGRYVATRATGRVQPLRDGRPSATVHGLLDDVMDAARVLQVVVGDMRPDDTAFHPAGFADRSGWSAMACDELLVHGFDIAVTVGVDFEPDAELVDRLVRRLFPWAPEVGTPIERLMWANGRSDLGEHQRLDHLWYWWCRPLREWDGRRHTRSFPPAW